MAFEVLSYWHMENEQARQPPKIMPTACVS